MLISSQNLLSSFAFSSYPGHKIYKEPIVKLLKRVNKSVLSHITFYLEDDDHKPVDFTGETISLNCQLIKNQKFLFFYILLYESLY